MDEDEGRTFDSMEAVKAIGEVLEESHFLRVDSHTKVFEQDYECGHCGAKDTGKFFENEAAPMAINCHQCHQGQGLGVDQMLERKVGMHRSSPLRLRGEDGGSGGGSSESGASSASSAQMAAGSEAVN